EQYRSGRDGRCSPETRGIARSRAGLSDADFRGKVDSQVRAQVPVDDPALWQRFLGRRHHLTIDVTGEDPTGWDALRSMLAADRDRVFYLASPPGPFGSFCRQEDRQGLVAPRCRG